MKFKVTLNLFLLAVVTICAFKSSAQQFSNNWTAINKKEVSDKCFLSSLPKEYSVLKLDFALLKNDLDKATYENSAIPVFVIISVPMPNGTFQNFKIYRSEVIADSLSKPFEYIIRTFTGKGIDDPFATAKFDYTLWGFHGFIISTNGYVLIDPYSLGNTTNYICYNRKNGTMPRNFICETEEGLKNNLQFPVQSFQRTSGTSLRSYRLALACTGEYAAYYGGTASGAFSGMVTSVNRVTGVYELEVSVRLVLISTTNLVYTNAATDPYTNNNGSTMLGENQTNITTVIGSANYDVGHVFSTGGGGVAGLGVVCNSTNKARGVTGSSAPIGDNFDIDYVAHEMGHEFAGNHTFNSVTGSCNGNRSSTAAYEPGCGTTIMSYAGICGADNTQAHSDAIFHTKSFDEIQTFITTGGGSTCPTSTATGNTAPVITVPGNYSIPYKTPFQLTGSATDVNGDALTYLWEEFDIGAAGAPNSPTGTAPIFRTWVPVTTGTRVFPRMQDVVTNTQTIGEILPTYARAMNFRLSVRDNHANGGAITNNDVLVTVNAINTTIPFAVTFPNTAVTWTTSSSQTVTWDVASTTASPISCANVNILLSNDGGYTYPYTLATAVPNTGTATITVPSVLTTTARVRVEGAGNIFFDISNVNFSIVGGSAVLSSLSTNTISPTSICAGASLNVSFTGDGPALTGNIYTAQLSNSVGSFTSPTTIGTLSSTSTSGTIACTISVGATAGTGYRIRVIASNPAITGTDNGANLTILQTVGAASAITGSSIVCQGQVGVVYSVASISNASTYNWTLPSGCTITAGTGTNSITVSIGTTTISGNVTVAGANNCFTGTTSSLSITVNTLPTGLSAITGANTICQSQTASFSVTTNASATSYSWTVPSGATIQSGAGTNSIIVLFSTAGSGTISVSGVNSCGNGSASTLSVNVTAVPVSPTISAGGPTSFCTGGNVSLSFTSSAGIVYQWLKDGLAISGATSSPYVASTTGNYSLAAYDKQTITNSTVVSIPDNICTGGASSISVSGYSGTVPSTGISISINITHTYDADLYLILQAPNGALLGLANAVGSSGDNFTNTIFSDAGATVIPATGAPYTGTYKPWASIMTTCTTTTVTSFAAIGGGNINPNGTWKLLAIDNAAVDVGTINSFSITFPASANAPCYGISNVIPVTEITAPVISSFTPTIGNAGTVVTITGSDFTNASSVTFNGITAVFSVTNNTTISATVPSGNANGNIVVTTPCGSGTSGTTFSSSITLNLKVLIEGFTSTAGTMRLPLGTSCDSLRVYLASPATPYGILYSSNGTINATGNGIFTFSGAAMGGSFYIIVKHRNSLETWSGAPILMPSTNNFFDFTTGITQAFGSNLINVGSGKYAIRSGDVNQNGVIDINDYTAVQTALLTLSSGYLVNDLTGDNLIESTDYSLVETNSQAGLMVRKP